MAYCKESSETPESNNPIEQYYNTDIHSNETVKNDQKKLSKISGCGIKINPHKPHVLPGVLYARHQRKSRLKDETRGDVNAKLYNACLTGEFTIVEEILDKHYTTLTPDEYGQTALFPACLGNQPRIVKYLIKRGYDVNHQDNDGKTPLHVALEWDEIKIAELLVTEFKASTSRRDNRQWTPMHSAIDRGFYYTFCKHLHRFFKQDVGTDMSWIHLHAACYNGDLEQVKLLLDTGVDVNHASSRGFTALHVACQANASELVQYLLEHGAHTDVRHPCAQGLHPLHLASAKASTDIITQLLKHGADVNAVGDKNQTALHIAASHNKYKTVELLISTPEVNLNALDDAGDNCLYKAVLHRNLEIVTLLLQHSVDVNCLNNTCISPLHMAIAKNEIVIVEKLLAAAADPNVMDANGENSVLLAIHKKHESMVEMLLAAGAQAHLPNADGNTCLHHAISKRLSMQTIKAIIQHGVPINAKNKKGEAALLLACVKEEVPLVNLLLQNHADPNISDKRGQSCLHWAVHASCTQILEALLDHGAHTHTRDTKGRTPFLLACQEGKSEKIRVLLQAGADPSVHDKDGDRALHNVIYGKCKPELVRTLTDIGVEINAVNHKLKTALALACSKEQTHLIEALLEAGADPNIADYHGNTCLHHAIRHKCNTDILSLLVKHDCDVNAVNDNSETALLHACKNKYIDASTTLLNLGADPNIPDMNGETAFHWSVHEALGEDFIQLLINHNASVDALDHKNRTVLMVACIRQDFLYLDTLLDATVDINIADRDGDTVLHRAIHDRASAESVQKLIHHGAHVDAINNKGRTALMLACMSEQTESAAVLLNSGANTNLPDKDGDICLHKAVWVGNLQLVQILMSHEININAQNDKQITPLYIACAVKHHTIAKILLKGGADVNIANYKLNAPLHKAVQNEDLAIITDLLDHGANIDLKGQYDASPLHAAVFQGSLDCMKLLLKYKPDLDTRDTDGETPLHVACRENFHDKAALLLSHGADTNCTDLVGYSAFTIPVQRCDKAMLEIFLKHDPSILNVIIGENLTALHYYCKKGNVEMVNWLLTHGVDKNKTCNYSSPLDVAFENGHTNIVSTLIDAGANVSTSASPIRLNFVTKIYHQRHMHMNILEHMIQSDKCKIDLTKVNGEHETLLFQACRDEAVDVLGMLVETRRNNGINIPNKLGKSAIYVACENLEKSNNESVTLLSMLLRSYHAIDLNNTAYKGMTPLHLVCKNDNMMMANMLLRTNRALISFTDDKGKTPLHYAMSSELVKLLLTFDADINKRDDFGQTPFLSSCEQGNTEAASTLLSLQPNATTSQDNMGRTGLHHCTISKSLSILKGMENLQVNSVDVHKQSALHYAAITGDENNIQQLLEMVANPNLLDKNDLSPLHVASTSGSYDLLTQHKANANQISSLGCSPSDMRQWHEQLQEKNSENLGLSIEKEGHTAIMKVLNMPLVGFMERNQQHHAEFLQLLDVLKQFMIKLTQEMKKIDPFMEAEVMLHGSSNEGTVVGTPQVLNFVFLLTKVAKLLQPPSESVYSSAYTTIHLQPSVHGHRQKFVDASGSVMVPLLLHQFYTVMQRAFRTPGTWSDSPQLYSTTWPESDNSLDFIFHGKVFKWLPVTVQIVPAIHFQNWRPSWCKQRCIPEGSACYLLAKDIPSAPEQKQPYLFQLDCLNAEEKLIRDLPPDLKEGFKLAKLMPDICTPLKTTEGKPHHPASHFISEQMLQTVTLNLSEEYTKTPEKFSVPEGCEPLINYAKLIYDRLALALVKTTLMSHFVPTYDLLKEHFRYLQGPEFSNRQLAKQYCQRIQTLLAES